MTRDIATRLEYQWVNNIGRRATVGVRPTTGMLSVGVSYVSANGKMQHQLLLQRRLQLQKYRPALLWKSGRSVLQQSDSETRSVSRHWISCTPSWSNRIQRRFQLVVLGFTDRNPGSDAYNQNLSENVLSLLLIT